MRRKVSAAYCLSRDKKNLVVVGCGESMTILAATLRVNNGKLSTLKTQLEVAAKDGNSLLSTILAAGGEEPVKVFAQVNIDKDHLDKKYRETFQPGSLLPNPNPKPCFKDKYRIVHVAEVEGELAVGSMKPVPPKPVAAAAEG